MTTTTVTTEAAAPSVGKSPGFLERPTQLLHEALLELRLGDVLAGPCAHALTPPGKLVRPQMMFATAEAVGGDPVACVPAAAGLEYCHVAALIHDDVIDGDLTRRGRSTVLAEYGADAAIVAGDALLFESFSWTHQCMAAGASPVGVARAVSDFAAAGRDLCEGQALEWEMVKSGTVSLDVYERMVRGKTGALFDLACRVGTRLSGATDEVVERFAEFGLMFGTAFQMQDDLLPYRDAGAHSGKDPLSDIRNGRISLPMILAIEFHQGADREFLVKTQATACVGGPVDAERALALLGDPAVLAEADRLAAQRSARALEDIGPFQHTDGGRFLADLVERSSCRNR